MCLNPTYVINSRYLGVNAKKYLRPESLAGLSEDEKYHTLRVPCGHCPECASLKQNYLSQRCELMSRDHYIFFQTLTLQNKFMKYVEVNGSYNAYFDITYFQNYIKILRKYDVFKSSFKFLAVTEYGGSGHRPHMHILYFVPKNSEYWKKFSESPNAYIRDAQLAAEAQSLFWVLLRYWRINLGSRRNPDWHPLLKFVSCRGRRNYDFQYVNKFGGVVHYVTKYILKYDDFIVRKQQAFKLTLSPEEYKEKWRLVKPRLLISKHFGDSPEYYKYLKESFDYSLKNIQDGKEQWFFINLLGKIVPMSPYIRRKFVKLDDTLSMFYYTGEDRDNLLNDPLSIEYQKRVAHFKNVFLLCRARHEFEFYELE